MAILKQFIVFFVMLIPLSGSASNSVHGAKSAEKLAKHLSEISSTFVYNLDEYQLQRTLLAILDENPQIKAIEVTESYSGKSFFSVYKSNRTFVIDSFIPDEFSSLDIGEENIVHNEGLIGKIKVYYEPKTIKEDSNTQDLNISVLLAMFIVFVSILVLIFKLLLNDHANKDRYLAFGTKKFGYLMMGALSVFVTFSIAGSWIMVNYNKASIEKRLEDSFHQYLSSLEATLIKTNNIRTEIFEHIFNKDEFQDDLIMTMDSIQHDEYLEAERYRAKISEFWLKYKEFGIAKSKLILSLDGNVIYAHGNVINPRNLSKTINSSFIRAVAGESSMLPAGRWRGSDGRLRFLFVSPIRNKITKNVIAISIIEIDHDKVSYIDLSNYNFSETGEMLTVSEDGNLFSNPRFSVIESNRATEVFNVQRKALYSMAKDSQGERINELRNIIDYRDHDTYAMIRWIDSLNVGVVVKIDKNEILQDYIVFRNGLFLTILIMTAFTVPSMLFTLYAGGRSNKRLKESRKEIIRRLGHAAEYKDNETAMHIVRISRYTEILGKKLGMSKDWLESLTDASPMHDIGKLGVPDAILQKTGKLTPDEWEVMKRHPQFGADIIGEHNSALLGMAKEIALNHHEKWDGTGYPRGLKGEDIPLSARVVAIADVFDALTSERPYKNAWKFDDAVNLIISESGKHFDPDLVTVFLSSIIEFKETISKYNDGNGIWGCCK